MNETTQSLNFGQVIEGLKEGKSFKRIGWHGQNQVIKLQTPTELSKMTEPYIYIEVYQENITPGGAQNEVILIPWLASQADMLKQDWIED